MHFAVVHDRISGTDAPDAVDVLAQADVVETALTFLGHTSIRLSCGLNLMDIKRRLEESHAVMVFNLVESIEGKGGLIHLLPALLDAMGIPYTGARTEAMMLTSNKVMAKKCMSAAGIPTPLWMTAGEMPEPRQCLPMAWIIKSVWEHASIGLDETSIVHAETMNDLRTILHARAGVHPRKQDDRCAPASSCFAEAFVDGREFNLSVLAGKDGPEVLPPAEIIFEGYTKDMPKIVDYRAKWDETAYAYHHTPRTFDFTPDDFPLLETLKKLALDCWTCFGLAGYARIDFRVDAEGSAWVLEVNANPCLSPDAGFAAALERAGITSEAAVERILEDSLKNGKMIGLPGFPTLVIQEDEYRTVTPGKKTGGSQDRADNRYKPENHVEGITFRNDISEADTDRVRRLVELTGFFHPDEVDVAAELVDERLTKGEVSGYHFIMADYNDRFAGYTCFGPIPCTESSFDLYWIAVHPDFQERGLGRRLVKESENRIRNMGGTRIYVDTSSKNQYAGTRAFYESCGYTVEAVQEDFYAHGDGRVIYRKTLPNSQGKT